MKLFVLSFMATVVLFAATPIAYYNAPGIHKAAYGPSVINGLNGTTDLAYKGDVRVGSDLTISYILAAITLALVVTTIIFGIRYKRMNIPPKRTT